MVDFNVCPHCSDEGLQIDHLGATCPATPTPSQPQEAGRFLDFHFPVHPHAGGRDCPWRILDWSKDGSEILVLPAGCEDGERAKWFQAREAGGRDLAWTREKPTAEGWYWHRTLPGYVHEPLWVGRENGSFRYWNVPEECWYDLPPGEWAGPIPEPLDGSAKSLPGAGAPSEGK